MPFNGVSSAWGDPPLKTVDVVVLLDGWYRAGVGDARNLPESLIVEEEEGFVPPYRATDTAAILILA